VRRRRKQPQAVGSVLEQVLADLGLSAAAAAYRVGQRWEEAVGSQIAQHCRPVAMRSGVLEATVDSSVWCQQLQLQRPEILIALRRVLGDDAPEDLYFRVGNLPPADT
jgi:predicted nucleic acid-binding Zn ribbon protein